MQTGLSALRWQSLLELKTRQRYFHFMFNASDIRELLIAKEFKPFVIQTTDGARYEITNHDMVMVARNSIQIGLPSDQEGIAKRIVRCAILHIARIEDLQVA